MQAVRQRDSQRGQGNFQQRYNKRNYDPPSYLDHLSRAGAEEGECTWPFAAPFMARRQRERGRAQATVGAERRELWAAGITATTETGLNYIPELPKIREFHITSACPAAPSCAPPRSAARNPASLYPICM